MGYFFKKISKKIMLIFIAFISMFIYIGNAKAANVGDKYYLTYKYNTNPTGGNRFTYYDNGTNYNYYDTNQQLDWSTNFKVEVVVSYEYTFRKIFLVGTEKIGGTTSSNNGLAISITDDARVYVEAAGRSATSTNAVSRHQIKVLFEWDASNNTAKTTVYEYSGNTFDSGRSFSFTTYPIIRNSHSYSANNLRIGRGYEDSVPYKLFYESFAYSKQYSYDPNNGVELIAPARINKGYVFRRWCSSSNCNNVYGDSVIMDSDKTAYSQYYSWNVDSNAGVPYMYGGETKIYGSGETIITTNVNNLDYPPGVNKYYSCGYSTDGTNFDHFTEPSTNNTFVVGATEYLGTRNYACYAYASDGFDSTPIMFVASNPDYFQAIVTILLPSIDFNTGDGVIPGDTARFYGKYNTSNLYDTETGDNIVEIPIGFLDGHKFLGWYTSDDSSGEKIIDAEGNFVPNVSGWTNEDGKFIKTSNSTLYAKYKEIKEAYLIEGSTINGKFDKANTTEFRRATLEEYNAATLTDDNIISTEDSPNVVYMWNTTIDSKVVTLYYTEADFMYMNADSSDMFRGLKNVTTMDLSDFDSSKVTNMEFMFGYIGVTSLDLSTFDTSNVTKMNEMFFNSANLQELNVSSFDVSNVTTMVSMFNSCPSLQELDLSSFDTRNVRLMGSMFANCSKLTTIYASNKWSTSGLNHSANQSTMFLNDGRIMGYLGSKYDFYWHGDDKAHIDGGPVNEGYLTDISHKGETHSVTFPDGTVELYNHNSIVYLDANETTLGEYTSGEITFKYHNGNIDTTSNQVFEMAGDGFTCDDNHYRDNGEVRVNADKVIEYAYKPVITNSVFPEDPEKDGYIFMGWFTEEEGGEKYTEYTGDEPIVLHAQYGLPNSYLISGSDINNKINYLTDNSSINEFRRGTLEEYNQAKDNFSDDYNIISTDESPLPTYMWYDGYNVLYYSDAENIYMNANSASMFSYTYASSIDVTEFDTSNVTDMSYMFSSGEMTELDLSHFNTSNVTNMSGMFQGCSSLQTIYVSNNWSTDSLEDGNGEYMFSYDENLVGSSGTTYDENHTDEEYARPDEGVSNPGYFTLVTLYNVTYPNSSTRSYKDGTVINLGENDSPAIIETAGTITFKYHDDETEDTTLTKITTKTPNGFLVNDIHIDDNEDLTINEDKVIEYDYDEEITGNEFPVPTRTNYIFLGWYTEEVDGDLVENYNGEEDITLHAHWQADTVTITKPDEVIEVPKGSEYNLGVNDLYDFYGEAEYVTLDYNLGDDSDPPVDVMAEYKKGNGWLVNGVHYDDNSVITVTEPITIEYDYVIDKPPYVLPKPTNGNKYFAGWYAWGNFDSEPYEVYYGGGDVTFVARWIDDPVNLTIDGKTKVVERGSEYIVPNGKLTSDNYITIYVSDRDKDREPVKIGYGKTVNYQNINGTNYEPGYKYIVNEDTTVITNTNNAGEVIMDPYIERPTSYEDEYGSYIFAGWLLGNWDYVDPTDINTDIYTLTPEDRDYNGQEFFAEYQMFNPETEVKVHIIDEFRRNDYIKIYEKGTEFNLEEDSRESNLHFDIGNNINDDYFMYEKYVIATVDHYLVNGESYNPNTTITLNEDIELEYVRVITSTENCGDEECPDTINLNPNSRYNDYIYRGTYTSINGEGSLVDIKNASPMGDSYGGLYQTVYQYFIDGTNNIILTVDEDVSIIPKGMGVIPKAKGNADEVIPITLVYQDDETPNGVANMTYKHTFEGYKKQNYWRVYNPGEEYDYEEDTYFYTSYENEWIYDELPYIDDDHFKGWWTEPEGGDRVDELEYMRGYYEDYGYDTLYAHWGEPTVEICHGKGDCEEIVKGTTVTLEQPEPTVVTANFTLDYNTEEPGYEPKNVTTTRTETVEYFMINNERYDFGETYTFNENVDMYGVTTYTYTSDFVGYYSDNWDYGLNINGYELRGWCATKDGRYCRHYDEDDDIVQPDGLTLYATYYSSEGDTVNVTVDWDTTYTWPKGESELIPDDIIGTITFIQPSSYTRDIDFDLNDGSGDILNGSIAVNEVFSHFRVGNDDIKKYQQHDLYTFYRDIHIQSQFTEEYGEITFPEMNEPTFKGWYTSPEGGRKISTTEDFVKYMDLNNSFTLYAQYYEGLPTDMELDTDNVSLTVGQVHQIGVTFTPEGSGDTITYTGFDDTKISVVDGLVTGLAPGETTITVGTENTDIEKTITVTVMEDKFKTDVYDVREADPDNNKDRIIIGAEPLTTIGEFKDNLENPNEYIKIYDSEGNELDDDAEVKTGLIIKLEYGSNVVDEATIVVRGDIDGDGVVTLADYVSVINHYVEVDEITNYANFLAADVDEDEILNMADALKIMNYYAEIIDTLND